jgi:hypothetical protein
MLDPGLGAGNIGPAIGVWPQCGRIDDCKRGAHPRKYRMFLEATQAEPSRGLTRRPMIR